MIILNNYVYLWNYYLVKDVEYDLKSNILYIVDKWHVLIIFSQFITDFMNT